MVKQKEIINEKALKLIEHEEHEKYHRKLFLFAIAIVFILFAGAAVYSNLEKWTYLDSLYFSASTLTTVGYGDFSPVTGAGKIFTIFYVFAVVGFALYGLSVIVTHFVEVREEHLFSRIKEIREF